jgi:hypothetical protein
MNSNAQSVNRYDGRVFSKDAGISACQRQADISRRKLELVRAQTTASGCKKILDNNEIVGYQVYVDFTTTEFLEIQNFKFNLSSEQECADRLASATEQLGKANFEVIDSFCKDSGSTESTFIADFVERKTTWHYHLEQAFQLPSFSIESDCAQYVKNLETTAKANNLVSVISVCRKSTNAFFPNIVFGVGFARALFVFPERLTETIDGCAIELEKIKSAFLKFSLAFLDGHCETKNKKFKLALLYIDALVAPRLQHSYGSTWQTNAECEDSRLQLLQYLGTKNNIVYSFCRHDDAFGSYYVPEIYYVKKD